MNSFLQIVTITTIGLQTLPQRWGASSVIVIGIAGVVVVLLSMLAMAAGFAQTIANTGGSDRALVLRSGSSAELQSILSLDAARMIMDAPAVKRDVANKPIASAEAVVLIEMKDDTGTLKNLTLRGVGAQNASLRPEFKLIEGRMFRPGVRELMVGSAAQKHFKSLVVGSHLAFRDGDWIIVGLFESNGDAHESEMLADADTVLSAYHRTQVQSVTVLLESSESFEQFKNALTANPALSVSVWKETAYYAQQSEKLSATLALVGYVIGGLMAVGAIFSALNSTYSAVSARSLEIATLRAIGFSSVAILLSILIEALLLALIGGATGAALALMAFNGRTISTFAGGSSQMVFQLTVTTGLVALGVVWACAIGLLGSILPAVQVIRKPIALALRGS